MNRKVPMKRSAPLSRGPIRNKGNSFKQKAAQGEKEHKARRAPKKRPGADKRYLDACRRMNCYLRIPGVCRGDIETTVPAHRNEGKGMGLKVEDKLTLPACYWCHAEYDQGNKFTREEKRGFFNFGYKQWAPYREEAFGLPA